MGTTSTEPIAQLVATIAPNATQPLARDASRPLIWQLMALVNSAPIIVSPAQMRTLATLV